MPSGPSHGHCKADACNGFLPNATCPPVGFEFLVKFKKAEAKVVGAANKARFTVWQKSFEYFAQLVDVELAGTQLNEALVNLNKPNATVAEKRANLTAALPKLEKLSRAWEKMTTSLQQTVMSAGTLGTLATNDANMYVRNFPFQPMAAAFEAVGLQLPSSALPTSRYLGPDRLFVRTVRTTVLREEQTLSITATLLSQAENTVARGAAQGVKQRAVRVHWRAMSGATEQWQTAPAEKIGTANPHGIPCRAVAQASMIVLHSRLCLTRLALCCCRRCCYGACVVYSGRTRAVQVRVGDTA